MKKTRKQLAFLLLLIPLLLITVWVLQALKEKTEDKNRTTLRTILHSTQNALRTWSRQQKLEVGYWSKQSDIKHFVKILINNPEEKNIYHKLDSALHSVALRQGYIDYFILDNNGRLIAGGDERIRGSIGVELLGPYQNNFEQLKNQSSFWGYPSNML